MANEEGEREGVPVTAEDWRKRLHAAQARAVRLRREAGVAEGEAIHAASELACLTEEQDEPASACLFTSQGVSEAGLKGGAILEVNKLWCQLEPEGEHPISVRVRTEAGDIRIALSHTDAFKLQRRLSWRLREMEDDA